MSDEIFVTPTGRFSWLTFGPPGASPTAHAAFANSDASAAARIVANDATKARLRRRASTMCFM